MKTLAPFVLLALLATACKSSRQCAVERGSLQSCSLSLARSVSIDEMIIEPVEVETPENAPPVAPSGYPARIRIKGITATQTAEAINHTTDTIRVQHSENQHPKTAPFPKFTTLAIILVLFVLCLCFRKFASS